MQKSLVRKGLVIGIIVLFIGAGFVPSISSDVSSSNAGNTLYVGGSGPGNYSKIQDAINDASNGDTVFVYDDSSPYYEHLIVDKPLNLIGENKDTTVIDGSGSGEIVHVSADWVNISRFTIKNSNFGIYLDYSNNNYIIGNNIITNNYYGIFLEESCENTVSDNTITGWRSSGICLCGSSNDNTINSNNINICKYGIYLFDYSDNNIINGNYIIHNIRGIYLKDSSNSNSIINNTVTSNTDGVDLYHSHNNIITRNSITYSGDCGMLIYSSDNNQIFHNNFNNPVSEFFEMNSNNIWDNGYPSGGNFWDDYNGVDNYHGSNQDISGLDGIGDTPYHNDNYPFMNPNGWLDTPPIANISGPYIGDEGTAITFNACNSSDPDGDELQYRWDFDDDGIWDTEYSTNSTINYTWYDDYTSEVVLEVTDGTLTNTNTTTVTVNNVAPTAFIDNVSQPFPDFILANDTLQFNGSFSDPGTLDTHTIEWDFGDGNTTTGVLTTTYAYSSPGNYTVTLTVTDDDGGVGNDTVIICVETQQEAIEDVIEDVEEMDLPEGLENALVSKLENAIDSLNNNNTNAAVNKLGAFINQVEAQRGKKLTDEEADALIAAAQWIIDNLNNG